MRCKRQFWKRLTRRGWQSTGSGRRMASSPRETSTLFGCYNPQAIVWLPARPRILFSFWVFWCGTRLLERNPITASALMLLKNYLQACKQDCASRVPNHPPKILARQGWQFCLWWKMGDQRVQLSKYNIILIDNFLLIVFYSFIDSFISCFIDCSIEWRPSVCPNPAGGDLGR